MEPVWFQYGSGIALILGLPWLTHRAVGFVKVCKSDEIDQNETKVTFIHKVTNLPQDVVELGIGFV